MDKTFTDRFLRLIGVIALLFGVGFVIPAPVHSKTNRFPLQEAESELDSYIEPVLLADEKTPTLSIFTDDFKRESEAELVERKLVEYRRQADVVANNAAVIRIFQQIHGMSQGDIRSSLKIYYPIYQVAEDRTGVSWMYLAIIHASETRFSLDPNPGELGFVGAMQRDPSFYSAQEVIDAAEGMAVLDNSKQRYRQGVGTSASTDYQEILWAADYIRRNGLQRYPEVSFAESIRLVVLHNYSADGAPRVWLFDRLKKVLEQVNHSSELS